jgi:hypothetical protein
MSKNKNFRIILTKKTPEVHFLSRNKLLRCKVEVQEQTAVKESAAVQCALALENRISFKSLHFIYLLFIQKNNV